MHRSNFKAIEPSYQIATGEIRSDFHQNSIPGENFAVRIAPAVLCSFASRCIFFFFFMFDSERMTVCEFKTVRNSPLPVRRTLGRYEKL